MTQAPTFQQVRRALARVRRGVALDVSEAEALLAARGEDLAALMEAAARVRDAGLVAAGRPGVVTYSPKVFIPLTRLCRDRCHYCTFVTVPGKLAAAGQQPFLSPDEVLAIASQGAALGCAEALFTLGDRPEERWPEAAQWLDEHGYDSTLDYVRAMAIRVLEETGLLPHLNPGVMSWQEINRLKPVSPSMGMMLETTSTRLFTEKGQPHFGSPDKDPAVRLRVLEDAGRLSVPFTSGLLVGIGETLRERAETIFALRAVGRRYGHLQEVIVQNFRAKPDTAMRSVEDLDLDEYLATIAVTRLVLGPTMRVQAPPNLVDLAECRALLAAGVDDWGGVSPLTPDHVNPERPWPSLERLRDVTAASGLTLRPRLTAHASYVTAGDPWIDPRVRPHVAALADADGYLRPSARPVGLPWQEPDLGGLDAGGAGSGRTDLHTTIDTTGRTTDRRSDFDDVYGNWQSLRDQLATQNTEAAHAAAATAPADGAGSTTTPAGMGDPASPGSPEPVTAPAPAPAGGEALAPEGSEGLPATTAGTRAAAPEGSEGLPATVDGPGPPGATKERKGWLGAGSPSEPSPATSAPHASPTPLTPAVADALRQAEKDPKALSDAQALALFTADAHDLDAVRRLADDMRHDVVGDDVTYVVNRNINFTNVCYTGCRFCAFAQRRTDADAYSLSMEQVADRAEEAWQLGATEVCMQGGIDPDLPGTAYFDIAAAVKRRVPEMHVHAFSPMEVVNGASRTGLSIHDWLLKAQESGLDTIPGTAAEILDDDVRWILTKGKLPTSAWVEVVTTAHRLGIRSSATMMYGHVDRPDHWVTHLRVLQRIQDETGGFTEFVPLPFVHTSAPIYLAGVARPGPTLRDNVAVHAAARILLHGRIDNVQTSWVKLGVEGTRLMLRSGCNDLGGTLMEETISRMAGSEHGSAKTVAEITEIAAGIGRPVRERTTTYGVRV